MLVCKSANGHDYQYAFQGEMMCWNGTHIIHVTFALLFLKLFTVLSMVITLTYFRPLSSSSDVTAKLNPNADAFLLTVKTILVLTFSFMRTDEYEWFLIFLLTVLSAIAFLRFWIESPYHNPKVATAFNVYMALFAWANAVLLLSKWL